MGGTNVSPSISERLNNTIRGFLSLESSNVTGKGDIGPIGTAAVLLKHKAIREELISIYKAPFVVPIRCNGGSKIIYGSVLVLRNALPISEL